MTDFGINPEALASLLVDAYRKFGLEQAMRYAFRVLEAPMGLSRLRVVLNLLDAKILVHVVSIEGEQVSSASLPMDKGMPPQVSRRVSAGRTPGHAEEDAGRASDEAEEGSVWMYAWNFDPADTSLDPNGLAVGTPCLMGMVVFRTLRRTMHIAAGSARRDNFTEDMARAFEVIFRPLAAELRQCFDVDASGSGALPLWGETLSPRKRLEMCRGLRPVLQRVGKVADSPCTVLITGETGTGKEVVADCLHEMSSRSRRPFIKVNCAAVPDSLVDSEFFGAVRGAFTGAQTRAGYFEQAQGGTILLDEVGELSPAAQARLLRVLDRGEIQPVGGSRPLRLDVRVLAATHRDLEAMAREGNFREDLWYRLKTFCIHVPPLRRRASDIPALTQAFLGEFAASYQLKSRPRLREGALDRMLVYSWPGNVRELRHVLESALLEARSGAILRALDVPLPETESSPGADAFAMPGIHTGPEDGAWPTLDDAARNHILRTLERCRHQIKGPGGAAELLGVPPSTLRSRMERLGLR